MVPNHATIPGLLRPWIWISLSMKLHLNTGSFYMGLIQCVSLIEDRKISSAPERTFLSGLDRKFSSGLDRIRCRLGLRFNS